MQAATPERISPDVWRNNQLSIAGHYGRCTLNGKSYVLDRRTDYLVREDVLKREAKTAKKAKWAVYTVARERQMTLSDAIGVENESE